MTLTHSGYTTFVWVKEAVNDSTMNKLPKGTIPLLDEYD